MQLLKANYSHIMVSAQYVYIFALHVKNKCIWRLSSGCWYKWN